MNKAIRLIPVIAAILLNSLSLKAASPDSLFLSDEIINIELRSDFTAILSERDTVPLYHPGVLSYRSNGESIKLQVKITSRGDFRRNPQNCDFPPLTIDFKKKKSANTIFMNQEKLKLVTPCKSDIDVIEEYLVYRMYNSITDKSLRVRLVNISYFDTASNRRINEGYSFFIEDEDHAANRNNAARTKIFMTPFDLDRELFAKLSMFQFMIGNKDWFVSSRKNIIVLQPSGIATTPYAVPYDFDFAGIVNADYTRPKNVPLKYLAERRVFKGICQTKEELSEVLGYFKDMKPVFISIIENSKQLPRNNKDENIRYLDEFYFSIENDEFIREKFMESCETRKDYNLPE